MGPNLFSQITLSKHGHILKDLIWGGGERGISPKVGCMIRQGSRLNDGLGRNMEGTDEGVGRGGKGWGLKG